MYESSFSLSQHAERSLSRMSDAGDDIEIEAPAVAEVEVATEAPKGKLTVEEALQVRLEATGVIVPRSFGCSKF